ncbi:MAG: hypothetical protein ABH891_03205 [Candidatus Omnitrophota bacterium]
MNKKILLAWGLIFLLLPVARVFAYEDTSYMDILKAKVNALEQKAKASDSKMAALESKMSQLESRIGANNAENLAVRRNMIQLGVRISDLEAAQDETENSGKKLKERTDSQETQEIT